jgi:hypothetical protein
MCRIDETFDDAGINRTNLLKDVQMGCGRSAFDVIGSRASDFIALP